MKTDFSVAIIATLVLIIALANELIRPLPAAMDGARAILWIVFLLLGAIAIGINIVMSTKTTPDSEIHIPTPEEMPKHG